MLRYGKREPILINRFLSRIVLNNSCWDWTGPIDQYGYGALSYDNKIIRTHRFSFEIFKGKLINGLYIDHICMNRKCVNPSHLRQVTKAISATENTNGFGAINKRKTHCPQGHPYSGSNVKFRMSKGVLSRLCKKCDDHFGRIRKQKYKDKMKAERNNNVLF